MNILDNRPILPLGHKVGKVKVTATTNKGRKFSCKVKAIKTTQSAVTPPVVTPEPVAPVIVDDTSDDVPDYSGHDIFS